MVNDNSEFDIPPLQAKYLNPPTTEQPDKRQQMFKVNTVPLIDKYVVDNC